MTEPAKQPKPAIAVARRNPEVQRAIELLQDADDRFRAGRQRDAWSLIAKALEQVQFLAREFPYEEGQSWPRNPSSPSR